MGRPLNKRFFGADANNNIKVQFHNGTSSVDGYIVKQKGTRTFLCQEFGAATQAVCRLVDKNAADLAEGEMSMSVTTDAGVVDQVTKITAHRLTTASGEFPWNFSTATDDGAAQIEEAGSDTAGTGATDLEPVITISGQPAPASVTAPAAATFTVTATATLSATLTYQWEVSTDGGSTFEAIDGETAASYTLDPTAVGDDGNQYRVVVTANGGVSVTSDAAALSVA